MLDFSKILHQSIASGGPYGELLLYFSVVLFFAVACKSGGLFERSNAPRPVALFWMVGFFFSSIPLILLIFPVVIVVEMTKLFASSLLSHFRSADRVNLTSSVHTSRASDSSRVLLHRPPGYALLKISLLFGSKVRENILVPTVSDLQVDHLEALADFERTQNRIHLWRARFVKIRGYLSFFSAIVALIPSSLLKLARQIYKLSS